MCWWFGAKTKFKLRIKRPKLNKAWQLNGLFTLHLVKVPLSISFIVNNQGNNKHVNAKHVWPLLLSSFTTECNSSFHSHKRQEIFLKEDNHSLDVSVVATQIARDIFECIFKCLRNPFCLSLNVAAFKDATGQLRCDLLSSDKHRNPDDFKSNDSSHYLFIKVGENLSEEV